VAPGLTTESARGCVQVAHPPSCIAGIGDRNWLTAGKPVDIRHIVPESRPMPAQAAAIMRTARVVLFSQIAGIVTAGPAAFYVLGFSTHPHHVLTATLTVGIVVVISIPVMWWLYRIRKVRASRIIDTDHEEPASAS
jgi:hypothetical protein